MEIPETHPRYHSLVTREKIVEGMKRGIVVPQGLIAHGRGEAFDYIMGEKTREFAFIAEKAATALLLLAKHPVISVNGNVAALVAKELVEFSKIVEAPLEVNLFHWSKERVRKIKEFLEKYNANVLAAGDVELKGIEHFRRIVDRRGIYKADVVLVPLEDGDRCEILRRYGKKVIAIDLNPLSRTSLMADITIVDNITRAIPNMIKIAKELKNLNKSKLKAIVDRFNNKECLKKAIEAINEYLMKKAEELV